MKRHMLDFVKRGLMAASGGPVILAIVYACLGASGVVTALPVGEVCMGILTVTLMAFLAAGVSVVYDVERLPLLPATLIHAVAIYVDYLLVYLLNAWISRDGKGIGIFTGIFFGGYVLVWLSVYLSIRVRTERLNRRLREEQE